MIETNVKSNLTDIEIADFLNNNPFSFTAAKAVILHKFIWGKNTTEKWCRFTELILQHSWVLILIVVPNMYAQLSATCISEDSSFNADSAEMYLYTILENQGRYNEACFSRIVRNLPVSGKEASDAILKVLAIADKGKGIGNEILSGAYRNPTIVKNQKLWNTIVGYWIRRHRSPRDEFEQLVQNGFPAQADTLFIIFDGKQALQPGDLAAWAQVKNIIGDFENIPGLLCRNIETDQNFPLITLSLFSGILSEMPPEKAAVAIERFSILCTPSKFSGQNFSLISKWFLDSWGRIGMVRQQIQFVNDNLSGSEREAILYEMAADYFRKKSYKNAALMASVAFSEASDDVKDRCAQLAFRSYLSLNSIDSALNWVGKSRNMSVENANAAIVLFQDRKDFQTAMRLIDHLPASLNRDTLKIRQHICNGEFSRSLVLINESSHLRNAPDIMQLWKLRVLLYSKDFSSFLKIVDSVRQDPHWENLPEMLHYRYWAQLLSQDTGMLDEWATIEYNNFIGHPEDSKQLCVGEPGGTLHGELFLLAVKEIMHQSPNDAVEFFTTCNKNLNKPDFIYYKAESLYLAGQRDSARSLLESLILEFSESIYSGKARLLLSQEFLKED